MYTKHHLIKERVGGTIGITERPPFLPPAPLGGPNGPTIVVV